MESNGDVERGGKEENSPAADMPLLSPNSTNKAKRGKSM
jgi:hypothetical protein